MAEVSVLAPATHKQSSRKGKKAWRKNVDLSEVQQGLETVRDEIVRGGLVNEKTSEELFVVDISGDKDASQSTKKLLKAEEILAVRSAVAGLDGRKRKAQEAVAHPVKRVKDNSYVTHKELQRLRSVADRATELALEDESARHDPWAATLPAKHDDLDFVAKPQPVREPRGLRQAPAALTANGKAVPAVKRPQGGKSYNPLVEDWSAVLQQESEAAVEAERVRMEAEALADEKEARALEEAERVDAAERDAWASEYESEWDGLSEGEQTSYTTGPRPRKTLVERNKIKARKARESQALWEKKKKLRDQQEQRIRQIAKEVSARDRLRQSGVAASEDDSSDSDNEPELRKARFGRVTVPAAPLEVVLPEELQDSLLRLKPEGNLMTDRYRTMLINGKMEVRKRRGQAKKRRVTSTEKWSYKDWKLR